MRRERKKIYICEWERRENIGALDSKKKNYKSVPKPKPENWKFFFAPVVQKSSIVSAPCLHWIINSNLGCFANRLRATAIIAFYCKR